LDSRREALDLLRLPFQIEIPVHPSDQVVRFVVEALRRVVQALPQVGKEPQRICAPGYPLSVLAYWSVLLRTFGRFQPLRDADQVAVRIAVSSGSTPRLVLRHRRYLHARCGGLAVSEVKVVNVEAQLD
jgi:hypothetical protein